MALAKQFLAFAMLLQAAQGGSETQCDVVPPPLPPRSLLHVYLFLAKRSRRPPFLQRGGAASVPPFVRRDLTTIAPLSE